jgi:hypothetical protein
MPSATHSRSVQDEPCSGERNATKYALLHALILRDQSYWGYDIAGRYERGKEGGDECDIQSQLEANTMSISTTGQTRLPVGGLTSVVACVQHIEPCLS